MRIDARHIAPALQRALEILILATLWAGHGTGQAQGLAPLDLGDVPYFVEIGERIRVMVRVASGLESFGLLAHPLHAL